MAAWGKFAKETRKAGILNTQEIAKLGARTDLLTNLAHHNSVLVANITQSLRIQDYVQKLQTAAMHEWQQDKLAIIRLAYNQELPTQHISHAAIVNLLYSQSDGEYREMADILNEQPALLYQIVRAFVGAAFEDSRTVIGGFCLPVLSGRAMGTYYVLCIKLLPSVLLSTGVTYEFGVSGVLSTDEKHLAFPHIQNRRVTFPFHATSFDQARYHSEQACQRVGGDGFIWLCRDEPQDDVTTIQSADDCPLPSGGDASRYFGKTVLLMIIATGRLLISSDGVLVRDRDCLWDTVSIPELEQKEFGYAVEAGNGYIVTTNVEHYRLSNTTSNGVTHSSHRTVKKRQDYYERPPRGTRLVFGRGVLVSRHIWCPRIKTTPPLSDY